MNLEETDRKIRAFIREAVCSLSDSATDDDERIRRMILGLVRQRHPADKHIVALLQKPRSDRVTCLLYLLWVHREEITWLRNQLAGVEKELKELKSRSRS